MRIGVISDSHGFLDPRIAAIFAGVNHILHAGDVGPQELLCELETIAPVTAVLGNTDVGINLSMTKLVELGGRRYLIHHIVDPFALPDELGRRVKFEKPDAIVFGHTHKRFYGRNNGTLFLNPGYSGRHKHGQERSVAILDCRPDDLVVEFIPL